MKLSDIFLDSNNSKYGDLEIAHITMDSRDVIEHSLFFALKGLEVDGHDYIDQAIERGAVAIVYSDERIEKSFKPEIQYIKVDSVLDEVNRISDIFFNKPSTKMKMYGVTGTNGKSTTSCIIRDILEKCGKSCGYMGTIAVRYADIDEKPKLTTPDAIEVHRTLAKMKSHKMDCVAMEVSSHGLAMKRTDSVDFDVAVFTNLSWDHLDFHETMEAYFEAKQRLFSSLKSNGLAVLNIDDESYKSLRAVCGAKVVSYGMSDEADYRISDVKMGNKGTEFTLTVSGNPSYNKRLNTNLVATYNIYNLVAAIAAIHETGIALEDIEKSIMNLSQVDGRMETIANDFGIDVIVDYAHTPDGFEKIFEFAQSIRKYGGRIISVFGSAGKRDKGKRPVLGRIASENSDLIYLTEEDSRDEHPRDIADMIKSESSDDKFVIIPNRESAIREAIIEAKSDDVVLILGKGDEKYLDRLEGKAEWAGDNVIAQEALQLKGKM